jgi:hypothetical protein
MNTTLIKGVFAVLLMLGMLESHLAIGQEMLEVGIDRPGGDLRPGFDLAAANPDLCRQACDQEPMCKAFTYVKPGVQGPKPRCWLKSEVRPAVQNDCCISGLKVAPARATLPTGELGRLQIPISSPANLPGPLPSPADLPGPLPSPEDLAKLTAPMTRSTIVQTLVMSPITGAAIAHIAAKAGTTSQGLASNPTSMDVPVTAEDLYGPTPPALLELWKAPVRCSPTVPGPAYITPDLGHFKTCVTIANGIQSFNLYHDLEFMLDGDYLKLLSGGHVWVYVELPPGGGQYAIALQAVDEELFRAARSANDRVMGGHVIEIGPTHSTPLTLVPNSDNTALVGMFTVSPNTIGELAGELGMRVNSILIRLEAATKTYYAGLTITRL